MNIVFTVKGSEIEKNKDDVEKFTNVEYRSEISLKPHEFSELLNKTGTNRAKYLLEKSETKSPNIINDYDITVINSKSTYETLNYLEKLLEQNNITEVNKLKFLKNLTYDKDFKNFANTTIKTLIDKDKIKLD